MTVTHTRTREGVGGLWTGGRRTPVRYTPWHRSKIFPKIKPDLS